MSGAARVASDALPSLVGWIEAHGVAVERWPSTNTRRPLSPLGHPVLHLVEPGVEPPETTGELEDWVRLPVESGELLARVDSLLARANSVGALLTYVDDDNVLRVGHRLIVLSPMEARLLRVLLANAGRLVGRDEVARHLWPNGAPSDEGALNNRVKRLRQHLADFPLHIHTFRGRGFLIERA